MRSLERMKWYLSSETSYSACRNAICNKAFSSLSFASVCLIRCVVMRWWLPRPQWFWGIIGSLSKNLDSHSCDIRRTPYFLIPWNLFSLSECDLQQSSYRSFSPAFAWVSSGGGGYILRYHRLTSLQPRLALKRRTIAWFNGRYSAYLNRDLQQSSHHSLSPVFASLSSTDYRALVVSGGGTEVSLIDF